ncbi:MULTISPECIES: PadR family transcriptional regulator [unclassified Amycolatopsis]|uniref:PadR family transcriptional regulator n=1 Tax=unclassified Amycolatopsis TaxID=2618356 RepID=UPI00210737B0|nr:PadR family transcriptional regulator [Amycolatopsis sp. DSM 110486]
MAGPRMTLPTQLVLHALLREPAQELYGLEICAVAGLPSGTIHPILARLEKAGWLRSRWEEADPSEAGRPRRRYYRLDPDGLEAAREALHSAETSARALTRLRPGLAGDAR